MVRYLCLVMDFYYTATTWLYVLGNIIVDIVYFNFLFFLFLFFFIFFIFEPLIFFNKNTARNNIIMFLYLLYFLFFYSYILSFASFIYFFHYFRDYYSPFLLFEQKNEYRNFMIQWFLFIREFLAMWIKRQWIKQITLLFNVFGISVEKFVVFE